MRLLSKTTAAAAELAEAPDDALELFAQILAEWLSEGETEAEAIREALCCVADAQELLDGVCTRLLADGATATVLALVLADRGTFRGPGEPLDLANRDFTTPDVRDAFRALAAWS